MRVVRTQAVRLQLNRDIAIRKPVAEHSPHLFDDMTLQEDTMSFQSKSADSVVQTQSWCHAGMIAEPLLPYVTYFHHSVRHRYGGDDLEIVTHGDEPATAKLRVASDVNGDGSPHETALFDWDASTERLSLVIEVPGR